jgi:ABC-type molybdate transport system, periplasmic component
VDTLQDKDQLLTEGTRHNLVNNQLIVMTYEGSKTAVTGIANIQKAASLAIPGGTVPAGNYTRKALIALGVLKKVEDSSLITTQQISKALGGVEINECDTVGAAAQAVSEGSNEVATCYYSDYVKYTKQGFTLKVLEKVSRDLTGDIIYPVCQVKNSDADELEKKAAADFLQYMLSDEAKAIYQNYGFDTDVKD